MAGLLERMAERARTPALDSESTILEPGDDFAYPDIIVRAKVMMAYYMEALQADNRAAVRNAARVFFRLFNEAMEEMAEAPPEYIAEYLKQGAAVFYWAASGESILNVPVPEDFHEFLKKNNPELTAQPTATEIEA
jgi:hypothetical protein